MDRSGWYAVLACTGVVLAASAGAQAASVVVRPEAMQSWSFDVLATGGAGELVRGPAVPPLGEGSARLFTGTDGSKYALLETAAFDGVPLAAVNILSFCTFVRSWNGRQAPILTLQLDYDGDRFIDDELHFEPFYQRPTTGSPALPDQGGVALNTWQTWDALAGGWWAAGLTGGATPGPGVKPLSAILAVEPDAVILDRFNGGGVQFSHGWVDREAVFDSFVDAFAVGTVERSAVYDFEPTIPEPTTLVSVVLASSIVGCYARRRLRH